VPTANAGAFDIAAGEDGNLWFTEVIGNKIGMITPSGTVTEFALPTGRSFPSGIAAGHDGNLWFAENGTSKIGRITTAGTISEFALPPGSNPLFVCAGPDGNVWFAGDDTLVGRITPAGTITLFRTPAVGSLPLGITAGPDGNIWFTEAAANKIARLTLDTTAPTLSLPSNVTVDATSAAGAVVTYTVEATDPDDAVTELTCVPASGTTFPIGDSTVACTASDSNRNVATGSFVVHVRGAAEQLSALRAQVASLRLRPFVTGSLDLELRLAQAALARGRTALADTALRVFMAEVRALPAKLIGPTDADNLVAAAARIRIVIM
jgi:sugar lactone lactonase YvrE